MKERDYVRIKNEAGWCCIGNIVKINEFREPAMKCCKYCIDIQGEDYIYVSEDIIAKSSPNILDILEPMDLLYIDIDGGFEGGIVVPRIPETLDELNGFVEFIKSGHWILKYVVTHEQLENNMYEVGE